MCQQWGTGPYNESKCDECPFTVIPVKELPSNFFNKKLNILIVTLNNFFIPV